MDGPTELLAHVARVRERLELGILDVDGAAAALGRIHLVDTRGHAWSVGVRSRDWYRFRDGRWMAAGRPPDPADLLSSADLLRTCPSCGASGDSAFCGECGTARPPGRMARGAEATLADFLEHGYDTLPEPLPEVVPPAPTLPEPVRPARVASPAPTLAPTPEPAPPRRRDRSGSWRRLRSLVSMAIGAGLLVLSGGRLLAGFGGLIEPPTVSPAPVAQASARPPVTEPPTSEPPAASTPTGMTWFADAFDTDAAWPTGDDGRNDATVSDGRYVLMAHATDLPAYRWAVNEATVGSAVVVEVDVIFRTDGPVAAGLVVGDAADQAHLVVLLEAGGQWAIARDDIEAFETLAVGTVGSLGLDGAHRLRLALDGSGRVSASLDSVELGAADAALEVARFGVAAWSTVEGDRVLFDDYLVAVPGG